VNLNYIGTTYGGWEICLDLVPQGSTIISAGVGEDISFDTELVLKKDCQIIGVDPTIKSHNFIENHKPRNFKLIKAALTGTNGETIKVFKQKNPEYVSESIIESNDNCTKEYHFCDCISVQDLHSTYKDISVLKMDIEGAEYDVIKSLGDFKIPQICVEFHQFCTHFSEADNNNSIEALKKIGYDFYHTQNFKEYTFVHNDCSS